MLPHPAAIHTQYLLQISGMILFWCTISVMSLIYPLDIASFYMHPKTFKNQVQALRRFMNLFVNQRESRGWGEGILRHNGLVRRLRGPRGENQGREHLEHLPLPGGGPSRPSWERQ